MFLNYLTTLDLCFSTEVYDKPILNTDPMFPSPLSCSRVFWFSKIMGIFQTESTYPTMNLGEKQENERVNQSLLFLFLYNVEEVQINVVFVFWPYHEILSLSWVVIYLLRTSKTNGMYNCFNSFKCVPHSSVYNVLLKFQYLISFLE